MGAAVPSERAVTVRIRLLGPVSVEQDGRPAMDLPSKALELLCFLLLRRDRAHSREELAALLWPDASTALARKYLRQALWQLQSALTAELLLLGTGWVRVDADADWWLDVDAFERAWEASRDVVGAGLSGTQAHDLEEAVVLYRGDLIEGSYSDWCIYERDRLQLTYLAMLEKLMGYCDAHRRYPQGVAYGHRILRHDPAREVTHQQLMRLHYRAGDRTTALRQYERCVQALHRELGLAPAAGTVALRDQIRADRLDAAEPAIDPGAGLLVELLRRFDQVQESLSALRQHVARVVGSNHSDAWTDGA
jgi:DNA-binding SARP family transcriptional activator